MVEKETDQKYFEFQLLMQQVNQLEQQVRQVKRNVVELISLASNLDEIKSIQKGIEMHVPMGAGIFIKTRTEENQNIIMNVGADVCVEKSVDDAIKLIHFQVKELQDFISNLEVQIEESSKVLYSLQTEISQLKE